MTTYIIISSVITFFLFILICYLFYQHLEKRDKKEQTVTDEHQITINLPDLNWKIYTLVTTSIILVIASFLAPFILTRPAINRDFSFSGTGQIGDTIGGLMNPFIALAGIIITGLAFYIQYKANQQQRALFLLEQSENKRQLQQQIENQNQQNRIQQFESQFYEMLRLHRENVTEMQIVGYNFEEGEVYKKFEKVTEGRKLFVVMQTEFECILSIYKISKQLNKDGFAKCYKLFFEGLDKFELKNPDEENFTKLLRKARLQHEYPNSNINNNKERKEFSSNIHLYFNYKPFSGHASRLGHYYRHLYITVKSIVNSDVIVDYDEKMKYLRILRAQLSNHEQIFLFYNWLSGYGSDWQNGINSFFSEYCMIHNLRHDYLLSDTYISESVNFLRTLGVTLRKGKMFEID